MDEDAEAEESPLLSLLLPVKGELFLPLGGPDVDLWTLEDGVMKMQLLLPLLGLAQNRSGSAFSCSLTRPQKRDGEVGYLPAASGCSYVPSGPPGPPAAPGAPALVRLAAATGAAIAADVRPLLTSASPGSAPLRTHTHTPPERVTWIRLVSSRQRCTQSVRFTTAQNDDDVVENGVSKRRIHRLLDDGSRDQRLLALA